MKGRDRMTMLIFGERINGMYTDIGDALELKTQNLYNIGPQSKKKAELITLT